MGTPTALVLAGLLLAGCGAVPKGAEPAGSAPSAVPTRSTTPFSTTPAGPGTSAPSAPSAPSTPSTGTPAVPARPSRAPTVPAPTRSRPPASPPVADGRPGPARITIPALDIDDFRVRPHRGTPDDARGTRIQNGGDLASPYGTGGLVGPGGLGNYLVTGHRSSSTRPFEDLPRLRRGATVHVEADGVRYTYRIVDTRRTSFRSKASLEKQSAAVPGRPGADPTRGMITLSTCRTPEDRAEGNDWSDRFGNPEHRIDKIGVLVAIRPS
jgi:sortase A